MVYISLYIKVNGELDSVPVRLDILGGFSHQLPIYIIYSLTWCV